jgi:hypothetical protein
MFVSLAQHAMGAWLVEQKSCMTVQAWGCDPVRQSLCSSVQAWRPWPSRMEIVNVCISSWFLKKINKIDKPLANVTKMRREKTQISNIRNKKGEITTNTKEIQGIIRDYFEILYSNTLENLRKWTNL